MCSVSLVPPFLFLPLLLVMLLSGCWSWSFFALVSWLFLFFFDGQCQVQARTTGRGVRRSRQRGRADGLLFDFLLADATTRHGRRTSRYRLGRAGRLAGTTASLFSGALGLLLGRFSFLGWSLVLSSVGFLLLNRPAIINYCSIRSLQRPGQGRVGSTGMFALTKRRRCFH